MTQTSNSLWVEKHRPKNLDTYLGNELVRNKIEAFIKNNDIPHLLLAGRAGTGKTTLAKILVNHIDCDYLFINASDENNVETIRTKIKGFVTTMSLRPMKIVVLDEADYVTPNAQAALRNLMEAFSNSSRFILTCNYAERIIDPIISRTQAFDLVPPSVKEVAIHLAKILSEEGVEYSPIDVKTLVVSYYPDIRKVINTAQLMTRNGKLHLDMRQLVGEDSKLGLLTKLLDTKVGLLQRFKSIREMLHNNHVRDYAEFYTFLYQNIEEFPEKKHPEIILAIAEAQKSDSFVVDKEINFAALTYRILEAVG